MSTSLLMHLDGVNNSTTIVDDSGNSHGIGTSSVFLGLSTSQSKFGGSSLFVGYVNGTVRITDHASLNLEAGDFTIDFWINVEQLAIAGSEPWWHAQGGYAHVVKKRSEAFSYAPYAFYFDPNSYTLRFYASATDGAWDVVNGGLIGTLTPNVWNHVAVTRSGGSVYRFLNGALIGTDTVGTSHLFPTTDPITISSSGFYARSVFYIDELRILKGEAAWTSAFTPPTTPYADVTPNVSKGLLFDNFNYDSSLRYFKWDNADGFGSGSRRADTYTSSTLQKKTPEFTQLTVGFAFYPNGYEGPFLEVRKSWRTIVSVWLSADRTMTIYSGDRFSLLASSAADYVPAATWTYVEVGLEIHPTTGSVAVRKNGETTPSLSVSNVHTGIPSATEVVLLRETYLQTNSPGRATDVYLKWGEITYLGDCRVLSLLPSANSTPQDFTPTSGDPANAYSLLRTDDLNGGVKSSTVGHVSRFTIGPPARLPVTVHSVAALTMAKKTSSGTRGLKSRFKSGATEVTSSEKILSTSTEMMVSQFDTDPNTSAAWTPTALNTLEMAVEVSS